MEKDRLKQQVAKKIDCIKDELVALSHLIHRHPETSFEERKAAAWLSEKLESNGFQVEKGLGGLETAFRAVLPQRAQQKPVVALLAEYDALPELGHACGHNIIATASVGAAIGLTEVISHLKGTIQVIGTPAEESGCGKKILVEKGIFSGVDAAMMVHPSNRTLVARGSLASQLVEVKFYGKAAHAAAYPENGINALDGVIETFNNINALRQHLPSDVRIHGIITHGGTRTNIVPDFAAARFQVRTADDEYLDQLLQKVENCARAAALATGATVEFVLSNSLYQAMRPNRALAELFAANLRHLGEKLDEPPQTGTMGSTDMGNVSQAVPAIHPYIAICPKEVVAHSPQFAEAAISDRADRALITAAKALAMTAVDLLSNAAVMSRVQQEFKSHHQKY